VIWISQGATAAQSLQALFVQPAARVIVQQIQSLDRLDPMRRGGEGAGG